MIYDILNPIPGLNLIPKPRYVWAAVAAGVVSAGAAVYSASKNKKVAPQQAAAIDPGSVANQAIQSNIANQGDIQKLVSSTNAFDQSQALSLMNQAMPGYSALSSKLTSTANRELDNPYAVPADVQQNIARLSAEHGVSTGRTGQAGQFSLLRDLGVNELQFGQSQISQASGITQLLASIAPKVNPMSPMSMYLTPAQALGTAEQNQSMQQGGYNAQAAAQNANAQTNANMWGQIGSAASGALSAGIAAYAAQPTSGGAIPNTVDNTSPSNYNYSNPTTPVNPDLLAGTNKNGMYA